MDLIKDTGTMVVHNPESNMGNACGCPPTMELVRRGILTGLGTDGYTHDMTESYKAANVLHKHCLLYTSSDISTGMRIPICGCSAISCWNLRKKSRNYLRKAG